MKSEPRESGPSGLAQLKILRRCLGASVLLAATGLPFLSALGLTLLPLDGALAQGWIVSTVFLGLFLAGLGFTLLFWDADVS